MAEEKPLTKSDLIAALKEIGVATKKDVDDIVHNQLTEFYAGRIQPEFDKLRSEFDKAEAKNEERFQRLEAGQSHIRDDIKGLETELSDTPSRKEVEELKTRVDHLERTN